MNTKQNIIPLRLTSKNRKVLTIALILALFISIVASLGSISLGSSSDANFSIVWITDTQHSSQYYPSDFDLATSWIVNNSASLNVKAVIHTGDLVDTPASAVEWANANHSMSILLNNGIPYCWDAGNHDQLGASWNGKDYTAFNTTINRGKPYWVSDYYEGKNTAIRLNLSSVNLLIVNIEYQADIATLQWANNLLDSNPSSSAIVGTHSYLDPLLNRDSWATYFKTSVLDTHPNVFLTLNGHYNMPTGNRTKVGNRNELIFDRQEEDSMRGGTTVRILAFDTAKNTVNVTTYIPYQNQYLTDPDSQFTLTNAIPSPTPTPSTTPTTTPTPTPTLVPTPTPTPIPVGNWTLVTDARAVKAYPELREYVWQKNASMPPNGQYDKIALHRLVKTGITPKGAVFIYEGWVGGSSGERAISNPPSDNWTKYENFSQPIYWANRGFEVYAMDFRTHFIPINLNLSQAPYIANWGFDQMMSDMKEGINKAKELSGFSKIFTVGHGNGAVGIMNYAAMYGKEDLRGIILLDADLYGSGGTLYPGRIAKRGDETNTYNLTTTLNGMTAMGTWAVTPSSLSATTHARFQYAIDYPGAPAEYPPGTPLSPAINPLTNKTWANITEYMIYTTYYSTYGPGGLSNIYGGYGNITVYLQYMSNQDRLIPARYSLESSAYMDWVNCPYLKYDFDDHYSEINVPVLAISSQLFSNRTGTFRFVNGMATTDFTGIMLPNYGLFDLVIGTYSARDVSQPALEWMINHSPSDWTLVNDGRGVKAYPDLKEYVWQKNPVTAPNGPNDKIGLHRIVKTGTAPKAVLLILPGERWANGEEFLSNPPQDNWTIYENYSLPLYLARRDFDVYALDYRSHFAPTGEGMTAAQLPFMINWGWDQWVSDTKEAVDKAKEVSGAKKIFILGVRGTGGEAAMNFASLYWKDDLRGLILFDGKSPVAAKPSGQTNTYNLTTQIANLELSKNYATPMWTGQMWLFRFRYALNNPGAPAEYPPGTPLNPKTNPLTNKTWTNITEWAAYILQYVYPYLSNIDGGYGNVTRDLQLYSKADQWWPTRLEIESLAISDWTNCPYVTRDFDELYNEINVPLLAYSSGFTSNQSGTYQFINGIKNSDFTGKVLANYGSTDMLIGEYARKDVFQPVLDWMINHLPPPLMTLVTQSGASVTAGNIVSFYVSVSGGVAPYTYQWYEGTSPLGTSPQIYFYPNTAGAYTYTCKITDAEGKSVTSDSATLVVNSPSTQSARPTSPSPTATAAPQPSVSPIPTDTASPSAIPGGTQLVLPAEAAYAIAAVVIVVITTAIALALKRRPK